MFLVNHAWQESSCKHVCDKTIAFINNSYKLYTEWLGKNQYVWTQYVHVSAFQSPLAIWIRSQFLQLHIHSQISQITLTLSCNQLRHCFIFFSFSLFCCCFFFSCCSQKLYEIHRSIIPGKEATVTTSRNPELSLVFPTHCWISNWHRGIAWCKVIERHGQHAKAKIPASGLRDSMYVGRPVP